MTQQIQQPDLSVYAGIDPDTIYNAGGDSLTFFYTGTMYARPYPTNHDDMLREDSEMFYDVFPDLKRVLPPNMIGDFLSYGRSSNNPRLESMIQQAGLDPFEVRQTGGSRGKALKFGDALLGRVGELHGDVVMALWQDTSDEYFDDALSNNAFIAPIRQRFGNLNEMIVVGKGEEPRFWKELAGEVTPVSPQTPQAGVDTQRINADKTQKKKYDIAGGQYTREELGTMRGKLHSSPRMSDDWSQTSSVLCSDDLLKYPELSDYRPAFCNGIGTKSRSSAEKWVDKTRELYTKEKASGNQPSTGLLYPAWRAHSESRKPLTFRDFLVLDAQAS